MSGAGQFELDTRRGMRVLLALGMASIILALFPYTRDPTDIKYLIAAWSALLLAIAFCLGVWVGQTPVRRPSLLTWIILGFWIVNLLASLHSDYVASSLNEMRIWTVMVVLYLLAAHAFRTPNEMWRFAAVVCVAVTLSSLYGFCQKFGYDPFPWSTHNVEEYRDLPSTFGNPNFAGHMLGLTIPLALALALRPKYRWCLLLAGVMLVHLYFTRIRGTVLGLAGAGSLVVAAYAMRRMVKTPFRAAVATLMALVIVGVAGLGAIAAYSKIHTGRAVPLDGSLLLRYQGYFGACKMIADRPVLGWGTENYRLQNPGYWTAYEQHWFATEHKMNFHVHDDYLEAAVDAGIPGVVLYIALLVCALVYGLATYFYSPDSDRRRLGLTLAACLTVFAVDGFFGFNARVPVSRSFLFLLAGVAAAAADIRHPKPWASGGRVWACVILAIAGVCAIMEARVFLGQYYYQNAQGAKHWNRPDVAYENLEAGRRLIPWGSQFPRELGMLDMTFGHSDRAIVRFEEAIALNPSEVQSMVWLGRAHLTRASMMQINQNGSPDEILKDIDQSITVGTRALGLCVESAEAHELMARAYRVRGDWIAKTSPSSPEVSEASRQIVDHGKAALFFGYEKRGDIHKLIAGAYEQLNELDAAQASYRLAVEAAIGDERIWQLFFDFAQDNKRYPAFLEAAEWAMERLGTVNDARASVLASLAIWSAQAYVATDKELDRAQRMIERAVTWAPTRLDVWNAVAATTTSPERAASIRARMEKARDALDAKAGTEKKSLPASLLALLQVWQTNGMALPEATKAIVQACQERSKAVLPEGLSLEFAWMADMCVSAMDSAMLSAEARCTTLFNLGQVYMLIGAWEHADSAFTMALPALSKDQRAACLLKRAEALGWMNKWSEAFIQARNAIRQAPGDPNIQLGVARFLVRGGNAEEAMRIYTSLLEQPGLDAVSRRTLQEEVAALQSKSTAQPRKEPVP